jgi:hypothetical protein
MKRRLTTFVLAAFYLLQATWLLHAGMDLLLPTVRQTVAAAGDACCNSACGCPDDVKSVYGCCCAPDKASPAPAKKPSKPSFMEAARCKGVEAAMTQAFTQPVVCGFARLTAPIVDSSLVNLPELAPDLQPTGTALDKVPI